MAARNMGPTGPSQVRESTNMSRRHAPARWRHLLVSPYEYKMRGYNPITSRFEYWQTSNPNAGPPSGAALTNLAIAAVLVSAFPTNE